MAPLYSSSTSSAVYLLYEERRGFVLLFCLFVRLPSERRKVKEPLLELCNRQVVVVVGYREEILRERQRTLCWTGIGSNGAEEEVEPDLSSPWQRWSSRRNVDRGEKPVIVISSSPSICAPPQAPQSHSLQSSPLMAGTSNGLAFISDTKYPLCCASEERKLKSHATTRWLDIVVALLCSNREMQPPYSSLACGYD